MKKPKAIIFESVKWAWKTSIIDRLSRELGSNALCLLEDETLEPIKHNKDRKIDIEYYKNLLLKLKDNSLWRIILFDRLHFTKWPVNDFDPKYFVEIEEMLVEFFDVHLVLLLINPETLIERLKHTCSNRKWKWWKMNYDWASIEEEAEKDIRWQQIFVEKALPNSLIPYTIIDTTDIHKENLEDNIWWIINDIQELIKKPKYQFFIFSSPARFPAIFFRHYWIVTSDDGNLTRWGISHKIYDRNDSYWHVNKDFFEPFSWTWVFPYIHIFKFKSTLLAHIEWDLDSVAYKMVKFVNENSKNYTYKDRYGFLWPNCNTYVQWVLDKFPESGLKLPLNAIWKNYK